jgi:hypothetical protein
MAGSALGCKDGDHREPALHRKCCSIPDWSLGTWAGIDLLSVLGTDCGVWAAYCPIFLLAGQRMM